MKMGLDIYYYSNLNFQFSSTTQYHSLKHKKQRRLAYLEVNPDFHQYSGSLQTGFYTFQKAGHFCGGSYHLYNQFRDTLCWLANDRSAMDLIMVANIENGRNIAGDHFYELIFFSDAQGILDSNVCQHLYREFIVWRSRISLAVSTIPPQSDFDYAAWFMETYDHFCTAFRIASDGGCLYFS